jgi:hypothetical protein
MKHGKCVGCKKPLKSGEFVVLNGGAMVKTKTGAMMGDKRHLGFLTVNNHFDSKKNYRSMIIADNGPNGQFEFYACSHKCLAKFMSDSIMHLAKLDKIKKIELAPQSKLDMIGYEWGLKIVELMGFKGALITDESRVGDFLDTGEDEFSAQIIAEGLSKKIGVKIKIPDYIWKVAREYKGRQRNKKVHALHKKGLSNVEIAKKMKDHKKCFVK